jgi:hypothetical protein
MRFLLVLALLCASCTATQRHVTGRPSWPAFAADLTVATVGTYLAASFVFQRSFQMDDSLATRAASYQPTRIGLMIGILGGGFLFVRSAQTALRPNPPPRIEDCIGELAEQNRPRRPGEIRPIPRAMPCMSPFEDDDFGEE